MEHGMTGGTTMMQTDPTPYADINELLERLLSGLQTILSKKLAGLYLYGSLVTGDFDHGSSDIDLLAVLSSDLDEKEFASLQKMHQSFAHEHKEWDGRIEIAYLSEGALKTFKTQRSQIAIISPGEPFHKKDAGKDWLMNWYIVQEKGVALFGPPPTLIIPPISKEEFTQAVKEHVAAWKEWISDIRARPSQAYAILTMCRALYTLKKGETVSKKQAAAWAENELPEWSSLIQHALSWREAWRDEHVDHDATLSETRQFVHFVLSQHENTSGVSKPDPLP
jgi:predicted nucleotidyltransferase